MNFDPSPFIIIVYHISSSKTINKAIKDIKYWNYQNSSFFFCRLASNLNIIRMDPLHVDRENQKLRSDRTLPHPPLFFLINLSSSPPSLLCSSIFSIHSFLARRLILILFLI
ncbi:hypothetical protein L2E82_42225 [Cichorium intybus]|uniref:Uncharacterized protein n=1 Tax=Cichorium intybus TaxID=13427 RepID=A0ACB8ZMK6_CICIN|nr:hypothetical protein L2E82_42225 [Cichorium intybus]